MANLKVAAPAAAPKKVGKVIDLPAQVKKIIAVQAEEEEQDEEVEEEEEVEVPAPKAKAKSVLPTPTAAVAVAKPVAVAAKAKVKAISAEKKIGVFQITSVTKGFIYMGGSVNIDTVYREYMAGANLDNNRSVSKIRAEFNKLQTMPKYAGKPAEDLFTLTIVELIDDVADLPDLKAKHGLKDGLANLKSFSKKAVVEGAAPVAKPIAKAVVAAPKKAAVKVVVPVVEEEEVEEEEVEEEVPVKAAAKVAAKPVVKGALPIDYAELFDRYSAGEKVSILCKEVGISSGDFYKEIRKFTK